jgi:signal transduction histidine kinase
MTLEPLIWEKNMHHTAQERLNIGTWFLVFALGLILPFLAAAEERGIESVGLPGRIHSLTYNALHDINQDVEYYFDHSGTLTFDDVASPSFSANFSTAYTSKSSLGYSSANIWLRVRLRNESEGHESWILKSVNERILNLDAYLIGDNAPVRHLTLGLASRDTSPALFDDLDISFSLKKDEALTVYICMRATGVVRTALYVSSPDGLGKYVIARTLFLGVYSGILLSLIIYNLFLFFGMRDRSYLSYIFLALSTLVFTCAYEGTLDKARLHWPGFLWINHLEFLRSLPLIASTLFFRNFFRTRSNLPQGHKLLNLILMSFIVLTVIALVNPTPELNMIFDLCYVFTITIALILGVIMLRRGYAPAKLFLCSWGALGTGVIVWTLGNTGLIPTSFLLNRAALIGSSIEIILMSFALAARLKFLQQKEDEANKLAMEYASIQRLVHILCHDLSTPLSVINTVLEKIKITHAEGPKFVTTPLSLLTNATETMNEIIEGVKTLESLRSGKNDIVIEPVQLKELFPKILELYHAKIIMKGLTVKYDVDLPRDLFIKANSATLKNEILGNILSNAIKFSHPGGVIHLDVAESDKEVDIMIADEGIGIPDAILKNLFDPHIKTTRPGTSGEKGTGFGMPIVKDYVEYFDGRILVQSQVASDSNPQSGTTVHLIFKKEVDFKTSKSKKLPALQN